MLIKGYVLFLNAKASVLKRLEIIKEKENHKNKIKVYDAVSLAPCNALTTWKQRQSLHLLEPPFFSYSLLSPFSHTHSLSLNFNTTPRFYCTCSHIPHLYFFISPHFLSNSSWVVLHRESGTFSSFSQVFWFSSWLETVKVILFPPLQDLMLLWATV